MRRWGGDLHSATSGNWALSRLVGWFGLLDGWLADFVFTFPGGKGGVVGQDNNHYSSMDTRTYWSCVDPPLLLLPSSTRTRRKLPIQITGRKYRTVSSSSSCLWFFQFFHFFFLFTLSNFCFVPFFFLFPQKKLRFPFGSKSVKGFLSFLPSFPHDSF